MNQANSTFISNTTTTQNQSSFCGAPLIKVARTSDIYVSSVRTNLVNSTQIEKLFLYSGFLKSGILERNSLVFY